MVHCTVTGRLQARGPGCLPDVAVTVQLKNEGPYPVSKSWVAILECKPSQEGGLSSPKLFILLAHPCRSAVLLAQPEGIHASHAWCTVSAAQHSVLLAAETVCRSIPIGSLAIGQSWQHTLLYTGLDSPSMTVSLYLNHLHQQVRPSAHLSCAA